MRREGTASWPTPETVANATATQVIGVAGFGIAHGTHGMHGIGRYCACCDDFRPGVYACGTCCAPWERTP